MEINNNSCKIASLPVELEEPSRTIDPRVHVASNDMIRVVIKSKKSDPSIYPFTPSQPPSPKLPGESSVFPDIRLPDVKIDLSSYITQSRQIELRRRGPH